MQTKFTVGLDVGSTTVKASIVENATDKIVWQDYQRHETKQPEKCLEFLGRMEAEAGVNTENARMFMTGSGGGAVAEMIGGKFVQEVTPFRSRSRNSTPRCTRSLNSADRTRRSSSLNKTTKAAGRRRSRR